MKIRSWWFIHGMRLTRANPHSQMEAARSMRREKPKASTQSLAPYWRCYVFSAGQHGSFQTSLYEFTSLQKVAADKRMSGFPSQNLRHHASHWCASRCVIVVSKFLRSIWLGFIQKWQKNNVRALCASLSRKNALFHSHSHPKCSY